MHGPRWRWLVLVACVALLGACASKPVSTEKPLLRKIALIPATEPLSLTLLNENGVVFLSPITSIGFYADSKEKARRFNEVLAPDRLGLARRFTARVVDALAARGYKVELPDIPRPPGDPDDVDYAKIRTDAEMILQLRVDEVGVYSSKFSTDYLPRVNVQAKLYVKSIDDSLYDENLHFGVDAKPGKAFTIVADPKFAYPSFEALMARSEEIRQVFESGIDALADLLAGQLLDTLSSRARLAP